MADDSDLICALADRRRAAGLTLTELAARIGTSRQALGAIEAGRAVPSTVVSLKLARELGCGVEDLFSIGPRSLAGLRCPELAGARVAVGRVGERWVAHRLAPDDPTPADAVADEDGRVRPLGDPAALARGVLVAGCAPVLGVLAGRVRLSRQVGASWLHAPSRAALEWLAQGRVHVAGLHLAERDRPEQHEVLVRAALPGVPLAIVRLVGWRQGVVTAPGAPLASLAGLDRPGLRVVRRPEGSGAAAVLARALAEAGVRTEPVGPRVATHVEAAAAVRLGAADAAVVIEPVAEAFGLPFLPVSEERFELVVRVDALDHPGVACLLDRIAASEFAREVRGMGAYDLEDLGAIRRVEAA